MVITTNLSLSECATVCGDAKMPTALLDRFTHRHRIGNPPFLTACIRRIYAANFSFWAGVMPPMPRCPATVCLQTVRGMFGRSLL